MKPDKDIKRDEVMRMVYEAYIEALGPGNDDLKGPEAFNEDKVIYGHDGYLDSLGLINLIVSLEGKIRKRLNVPITLANEKAMSKEETPFKTAGTLTDYVCALIREGSDE